MEYYRFFFQFYRGAEKKTPPARRPVLIKAITRRRHTLFLGFRFPRDKKITCMNIYIVYNNNIQNTARDALLRRRSCK